jgi:hypothetical protein
VKDNLHYKAAVSHFRWKADAARATLDTYFNRAVGIGEHSNLSEEILKWTKVLAESEEAIDALKKYAAERPNSTP